jgi:nucleotide-binding universal stress UspA family protein
MKRIVVATKFSDGSARALVVAVELAKPSGADIDLLHVHPMPAAGEIWPLPYVAPLPSPLREVSKDVQRRLDELAAGEQSARIGCLTFAPQGDVADEIVEHADRSAADLIVIGKGSLDQQPLGKAAKRIIRKARCPVLVVPSTRA